MGCYFLGGVPVLCGAIGADVDAVDQHHELYHLDPFLSSLRVSR